MRRIFLKGVNTSADGYVGAVRRESAGRIGAAARGGERAHPRTVDRWSGCPDADRPVRESLPVRRVAATAAAPRAAGGGLTMAEVSFEQVAKVYADGTVAVADLSLEIQDKEFMVLVGPSGGGKTTALRMAAGLEDTSSGAVRIGDRVVNHVPSRDRDIAMVFQSYALYPHLTVYDNIAFGLRIKKLAKGEIDKRVQNA